MSRMGPYQRPLGETAGYGYAIYTNIIYPIPTRRPISGAIIPPDVTSGFRSAPCVEHMTGLYCTWRRLLGLQCMGERPFRRPSEDSALPANSIRNCCGRREPAGRQGAEMVRRKLSGGCGPLAAGRIYREGVYLAAEPRAAIADYGVADGVRCDIAMRSSSCVLRWR